MGFLEMERELSLFVGTFTTLLAIINPLEVLPVYLGLLAGKDDATHRAVAGKACLYSLLLCFFFLVFGAFTAWTVMRQNRPSRAPLAAPAPVGVPASDQATFSEPLLSER